MINNFSKSIVVCALATLAVCSQAQVLTEKNISMALASNIATETVAACMAKGYNVTATVVDRAGWVRVSMRADNAGPHTVNASRDKAFTSVSSKALTSAMLENVQKNPIVQYVPDIDGFLIVGGGVPIKVGNEVIGAVGVGGAPNGQLDEQCALEALEKFKDQLK